MSNVLRLALVDPNDASRESLKSILLGMDTIWLEADCSRYEFFPDIIDQTSPDVGVVSLDTDTTAAISLIARITQEHPDTALLAASESSDGQQILKAIRAGRSRVLDIANHQRRTRRGIGPNQSGEVRRARRKRAKL